MRLFLVGNDRSGENLLLLIQKHVYTFPFIDEYNNSYRTRVYSDGWGAYSTI